MFYNNHVTIKGKTYPVRYLNYTESEFIGCVNEGYVIDGMIMIGKCDCPIWETVIVWHEMGHVYLDTLDEDKVWKWTLENVPVVLPVEYINKIKNRMNVDDIH